MKIQKRIVLILSIFFFTSQVVLAQQSLDKNKAEISVKQYMIKTKNYKPISFGEFFEQVEIKGIQDKLKTKDVIKYSIVHTYLLGHDTIVDMYFHLDDKCKVLGKISFKDMDNLFLKENKRASDSIMNSLMSN